MYQSAGSLPGLVKFLLQCCCKCQIVQHAVSATKWQTLHAGLSGRHRKLDYIEQQRWRINLKVASLWKSFQFLSIRPIGTSYPTGPSGPSQQQQYLALAILRCLQSDPRSCPSTKLSLAIQMHLSFRIGI